MKKEHKDNLDFVVGELRKVTDLFNKIDNSSSSSDGRDKSKTGETIVKQELQKLVLPNSMEQNLYPKDRNWCDWVLGDIPVNIKISTGESADNAGNKLCVYVACTGLIPSNELVKYRTFFSALKKGIKNPSPNIDDVDYVFLVFNKKTNNVHWIGTRQLSSLTPNGKNHPFQIDWSKNIDPVSRSIEEARNFLLSNFHQSLKLASEHLVEFENCFKEFVDGNK